MILHEKLISILVYLPSTLKFKKYFKGHCLHFESQVAGLIVLEGLDTQEEVQNGAKYMIAASGSKTYKAGEGGSIHGTAFMGKTSRTVREWISSL